MDELVFFVGAGISYPAPSGLPLFKHFRDAIAKELRLEHTQLLRLLAPEIVFFLLKRYGFEPRSGLEASLRPPGARPNDVHRMLARALHEGATVWTPNFDTSIEDAYEDQESSHDIPNRQPRRLLVAVPPTPPVHDAKLLKPHGTLGRIPDQASLLESLELVFEADKVLRPLVTEWAERLRRDLADRVVLIAGYGGQDVDLYPALREGLRGARESIWFQRSDLVDHVRWRFEGCGIGVVETDNPSEALLLEVKTRFPSHFDDLGESVLEPRDTPRVVGFEHIHERRLPAAYLADRIGDYKTSRRLLLQASLRGPNRVRSMYHILNSRFIHRARGWRLIGAAARLASALPTDAVAVRRTRIRHQMLLFDRGQMESIDLDWLRRSMANPRFSLREQTRCRLELSSVLRCTSSAAEAELHARRALDQAIDLEDATYAARASYEVSIGLRWQGRYEEAEDHIRLGVDQLGGGVWPPWALFERGCLCIYRNQPTEALDLLAQAGELFEVLEIGHAALSVALARSVALRLAASEAESQAVLDDAARLLKRHGRIMSRDFAAFELGELARHRGHHDEALLHYESVSTLGEAIRSAAMTGRAEVARTRDEDIAPYVKEALACAKRAGSRFGWAHAWASIGLAEPNRREEAMGKIRSSGYTDHVLERILAKWDQADPHPLYYL